MCHSQVFIRNRQENNVSLVEFISNKIYIYASTHTKFFVRQTSEKKNQSSTYL